MPASQPVPFGEARIVVRSVNWLGDAVMALPAIEQIKSQLPRATLTVWTDEKLAPLWRHAPFVDQVLSFQRDDSLWTRVRRLRRHSFDLGLILPNSFRSALEFACGRVNRRAGYATAARGFLLTQPVSRPADFLPMRKRSSAEVRQLIAQGPTAVPASFPLTAHHLNHYLHLVRALGLEAEVRPPRLLVSPTDIDAFRKWLPVSPAQGELPVLGLNPGAEYGPAKRWPLERFAAAAAQVRRQVQCGCWIFGATQDLAAATELERRLQTLGAGPVTNLAGRTSLDQLLAGLSLCRVVLTNDSGPMHLAAAVGTPVVVPFGSTSPELTGPGMPGAVTHRVLRQPPPCAPCFRAECPVDLRCLTGISPEQAAAAILAVWS